MDATPFLRARIRFILVPLFVGAVLLSACQGGQQPTPSPSATTAPTSTPTSTPSGGDGEGTLPLGTLSASTDPSSCAQQAQCRIEFEVSCPDVQDPGRGTLVEFPTAGQPHGMIMILLGGLG